jgi:hypothetical protein
MRQTGAKEGCLVSGSVYSSSVDPRGKRRASGGGHRKLSLVGLAAFAAGLLFWGAFHSAPALAAGPSATITSVGTPTFTTIQVEGEVVPDPSWGPGEGFSWTYEVSSDGGASWERILTSGEIHSTAPVRADGEIVGLTAGKNYQLRLALVTYFGVVVATSAEPNPEFATKAVPAPEASIDPVTDFGAARAHFTGTIVTNAAAGDPAASNVHWHFECTPECPGLEGDVPARTAEENIEATTHGLLPGTEYQVTLVAKNGGEAVTAGPVSFTTETVPPPTISIDPVTSFTGTTARLSGRVEPNPLAGDPEASNVEWHFECEPECPGVTGGVVPSGAEGNDQLVTATATGLEPNTEYAVRLVGKNAGEPVSAGPVSFATAEVGPAVETLPAFAIAGGTEALIGGSIDPRNTDTSYWLEWGPTTAYNQRVPLIPMSVGAGNQTKYVSQRIEGLAPSTVYHVRLIAESTGGATAGDDISFETAPAGSPLEGGCANALLRDENGSTDLPECRAYELVSPANKNGNDVGYPGTSPVYIAAENGEAVTFLTHGALPGAQSSKLVNQNLSTRGSGGWSTEAINPPAPEHEFQFSTIFQHFSANLERAVMLGPPQLPLAPEAVADEPNLFLRDNTDGSYRTLNRPALDGPQTERGFTYYGESADSSHVVFETQGALTPEAPSEPDALANLYDRAGGELRLVSILPDGEPAPYGITTSVATNHFSPPHSVSEDGSRILFVTRRPVEDEEEQIYLREDGVRTVQVSKSQRSIPDPHAVIPVLFGASADGSKVVFSSEKALTDDAEPGSTDVYRYDVQSGRLEDLSTSGGPSAVEVIAMSEDASYVYFRTIPGSGNHNIYVSHGGKVRYFTDGELSGGLGVSPSGRYLTFESGSRLTAYDNTDAATGGTDTEVYVYDADLGRLTCVSCRPSGAAPAGSSILPGPPELQQNNPQRLVLDDGTAFFESADAVLPTDTNGAGDVYEERGGQVMLLSTGTSGDVSGFAGASADGRDAFIFTRQRLVPADTDNNRDIYDARIGGGFPAASPGAAGGCQGEECQGQASSPPPSASPASSGLGGSAGHAAHHKRKKHRKHHHKHRTCHVSKKSKGKKHRPKTCKRRTVKTSKGGVR